MIENLSYNSDIFGCKESLIDLKFKAAALKEKAVLF